MPPITTNGLEVRFFPADQQPSAEWLPLTIAEPHSIALTYQPPQPDTDPVAGHLYVRAG